MKKLLFIILILFIIIHNIFADDNYVKHIGHSTVLIHLDDINILADPNWNGRNLLFIRTNPPAISITNLPPIDIILISHGHFDHMDLDTIKKLYERNKQVKIFLPKNLGGLLEEMNITNFIELNENENIKYKGITIKSYRARHNGTRYWFSSIDTSLALCYIIKGSHTVFFSGDTGYTNLFKQIGNEHKIDLAFIEIQGYEIHKLTKKEQKYNSNYSEQDIDKRRGYVYTGRHLHPNQAVKVFIDLKAKKFIPIHYGAFFTAFRGNIKILDVLKKAARNKNVEDELIIKKIGTKIKIE